MRNAIRSTLRNNRQRAIINARRLFPAGNRSEQHRQRFSPFRQIPADNHVSGATDVRREGQELRARARNAAGAAHRAGQGHRAQGIRGEAEVLQYPDRSLERLSKVPRDSEIRPEDDHVANDRQSGPTGRRRRRVTDRVRIFPIASHVGDEFRDGRFVDKCP